MQRDQLIFYPKRDNVGEYTLKVKLTDKSFYKEAALYDLKLVVTSDDSMNIEYSKNLTLKITKMSRYGVVTASFSEPIQKLAQLNNPKF